MTALGWAGLAVGGAAAVGAVVRDARALAELWRETVVAHRWLRLKVWRLRRREIQRQLRQQLGRGDWDGTRERDA